MKIKLKESDLTIDQAENLAVYNAIENIKAFQKGEGEYTQEEFANMLRVAEIKVPLALKKFEIIRPDYTFSVYGGTSKKQMDTLANSIDKLKAYKVDIQETEEGTQISDIAKVESYPKFKVKQQIK